MSKTPRTDGLWVALMDSLLHCGIHPSSANVVFQKVQHFSQLETELATANAENARLREDAERWRTLPAFLTKHQINYVMLLDDIDGYRYAGDAARKAQEGGK